MTNSLVKVIDNALLPAVLIIFSKFLGIYFSSVLFNIEINFAIETGNLFNLSPIVDAADVITLSTYSDVFMFSAIVVGFGFVVIKSVFFHESHISVSMIAKLAEHNLLNFIKSSYELYHSAITWFIFIWLTVIIILINTLIQKTEYWVLFVSLIFTISLSVVLVRDMLKEIELLKEDYYKNKLH